MLSLTEFYCWLAIAVPLLMGTDYVTQVSATSNKTYLLTKDLFIKKRNVVLRSSSLHSIVHEQRTPARREFWRSANVRIAAPCHVASMCRCYIFLCVKHLTIISASYAFSRSFCSSVTTQMFHVELMLFDATFLFLGFLHKLATFLLFCLVF
jgi:hypothetical protein